ncbi:class I SAM-dependent methyltransferase [bacterium]|nr:class I SAM-dependent methyltransferase [bacterium]MDC3064556.1 class I SAM-dependent methyltransferase [bacterium]
MKEIDFMNTLHSSTKRNYLARVNDLEYPKYKAASLAKKFDFDYWDGDRRICYGGYKYIPGRWEKVAKEMITYYGLNPKSKILDIGCGKGYLLYEFIKLIPEIKIFGLDISEYALNNCKDEISKSLKLGNATNLPYETNYFDLVISINTLHCLHSYELDSALKEMERVGKQNKYLCVESYRNEREKANLLYWQVTCEAFNSPKGWKWWFKNSGYTGDYSFIYFQ